MAETNLFEKIKKANSNLKTIDLKGKPYVQVKDRIVAFRSIFPKGKITTNYVESENYVIFEAIISDENCNILATGHARTLRNKDKCYEKCESNAVGRALAYCGFGTSESIESYEGMQDYEEGSGAFSDIPDSELLEKFEKLSSSQKANILNLNHTTDVRTIKADVLRTLVENIK